MLGELDLTGVTADGVVETVSRRGQSYVTLFLAMQRQREPVIFAVPCRAVPGRGKAAITAFSAFLTEHGGNR